MSRIFSDTWLMAAVAGVGLLVAVGLGIAGEEDERHGESHERVRALQDAGDIRSLEDVLGRIREEHGGRVLEAELEHEGGRYVYEVELLDEQGHLDSFTYDARTGEALGRGRR